MATGPHGNTRRKIAVVGSGIAGLTAAHVLQRAADVTLYEADDRVGGHAHTHDLVDSAGNEIGVDTGFIVHNRRTYPTLLRLFGELDVMTQESEMSMSVRCEGCGLEYSGANGLRGVLGGQRTILNLPYLRMLTEIVRFHRTARRLVNDANGDDLTTLGEFVAQHRFSGYFDAHFVTPLIAAVWSSPAAVARRYPARYLFNFLENHHMLRVTGSPVWRTVSGGSARYVEKVVKNLHTVRTDSGVKSITRHPDGALNDRVDIVDVSGHQERYDAVVVATHPHQALTILADATAAERATLGAIPYSTNPTVLHSDTSVLPRNRNAQASWNYLLPGCNVDAANVMVSYDMNRLQRLDTPDRFLVSLNQPTVDPRSVIDTMVYEHPMYTPESVAAQRKLPLLSTNITAFAGAYHGWGFHEDGAVSGVTAAACLGVRW